MDPRRPISELAARWSALLIADLPPSETLTAPALQSGSLLRAPADEETISEAEERLGRRLPPSYREFLLASDGAYGDLFGAITSYTGPEDTPGRGSTVVGTGFLAVRDIGWLRDVDPTSARIWGDPMDFEPERPVTTDDDEPWPWTPMARGLRIGIDHAPGTTCLVPFDDASDGRDEWQVWQIVKETSTAFRSFRSMLEREVDRREPVVSLPELEVVVERAVAGDRVALARIGRTVTPDAVPLLRVVAEAQPQSALTGPAAQGLARVGTPEAIEALVGLNPYGLDDLLALAATEYARDLLFARGAYLELGQLGDPRAVELAARALEVGESRSGLRSIAIGLLGRSGDASYAVVLRPYLASGAAHERLSAAQALLDLGLAEGREYLERLVDDPDVGRRARLLLSGSVEG